MQNIRTDRVSDLLKQEIADILTKKVRDPRVGFVTLTHVEVSNDLRHARIYVSIHDKQNEKKALAGLKRAGGFLRSEVARRLPLRRTPELAFFTDKATEKVSHLLSVLEELHPKEEVLRHPGEGLSEKSFEET